MTAEEKRRQAAIKIAKAMNQMSDEGLDLLEIASMSYAAGLKKGKKMLRESPRLNAAAAR